MRIANSEAFYAEKDLVLGKVTCYEEKYMGFKQNGPNLTLKPCRNSDFSLFFARKDSKIVEFPYFPHPSLCSVSL